MDPFKQLTDVSTKILTECSQYAISVKHAKRDIERLRVRLANLNNILQQASMLVRSANVDDLIVSKGLEGVFRDCQATLEQIYGVLEAGSSTEMRRLGQRALEWPLKEKEVTEAIAKLERYEQSIMSGLQIDQTRMIIEIKNRMDNMSLAQREQSPNSKTSFLVPYYQDTDYVNRPALERWLQEQDTGPHSRFSLVGLGGFGKSQLAIEYAYRVHRQASGRHVFWVHGATRNSIEDSYRDIANSLSIEGRGSQNADIMELVRGRLQIESKPWLMIVDNADNMDTFFSSGSRPIASYFPKSALGKILITSRSVDVAERLTGTEKAIKRLGVMDDNEALEFLRKKATREIDDADGRSLIKILESVPLAMNQAVAYINRRRIPVSRYLEIFQRSNRDKSTLLNFDSGDIRRNENVSNSIITTWQVTLNQIQEEHRDAANLLSLMSFFHNTNIPKAFLRGDSGDPDDGTLDDNLDILSAYSLVVTDFDSDICDMHSLVQFCTQKWLAGSNDLAHSKHTFLEQVCGQIPKREDANFWKLASAAMFHIDSALDNDRIKDDDIYSYDYAVASIYLVKSIEHSDLRAPAFTDRMARAALRNNQPSTALIFMHGCANAYLIHGDVEKAALVYERINELDIEDDDSSTPPPAQVQIDQLRFYRQQGQLEEANALASKLINRIEDQIAQHDTNTPLYERLTGFDNLISIYDCQLQPADAEAAAQRFIDACQGNRDKHDVQSLILVKNLATRYATLDQFGMAAGISKATVEISTKLLGPMHIETLGARYNEAFALAALCNYKEAEEMAQEIYNAQREVIGPTSQHTVLTLSLLGRLKHRNGHHAEAIALLEKGLREAEDVNKGPMKLQEACESLLATMLAMMKKGERDTGKAVPAEGGVTE